jgi:hypothetical protein
MKAWHIRYIPTGGVKLQTEIVYAANVHAAQAKFDLKYPGQRIQDIVQPRTDNLLFGSGVQSGSERSEALHNTSI